ncbi:MAG TPA: succinate dehydrogenase [Myxococcales bacterium]|nr:succinate dehydrogenase [Myxococcales bacterium]
MSATAAAQPLASPAAAGRSYLFSKLGSFIGLVPLGVWTTIHLWNNLAAFAGARAWNENVTHHPNRIGELFGLSALVLFILWHTVWGLSRMKASSPNGQPYLGNWRWWLQRISAVGLLLFLGAHLYLAKLEPLMKTGRPETFEDIAAHMAHHAPTLIVYILGIAAIAYHLGNGLWNFSFSFGLITSQRGLKWGTWAAALVVIALLIIGWLAVFALWQAGQPFPVPAD